jgi:3-isopropylmalate dehydrogenase
MSRGYKIAVMAGDGIGPEVTAEAVKVLKATEIDLEFIDCFVGGSAYLKNGDPLPPEAVEASDEADAILFGAIGHDYAPYDIPRKVLVYLRVEKEAYANIRPLRLYPGVNTPLRNYKPNNVDLIIVRDNSEGFSLQHSGLLGNSIGTDRRVITQFGAQRIIKFAYDYASKKGRNRVTCVDQSNWLFSDKLFRSVFHEVSDRYHLLQKDFKHVDVTAMLLARNPRSFDVIVTPGLYGDILSGIVIGMIGGVGMAPSACVGENFAFFEPVHGAAWDLAGKGVANPIASILSAKLMLEWLKEDEAARRIDQAVTETLADGMIRTFDIGGRSRTSEVGDVIAEKVPEMNAKNNILPFDEQVKAQRA